MEANRRSEAESLSRCERGGRDVDGALWGATIGELARVGTAPLGLRTGVVFDAGGLGRTNGQRETCAPCGEIILEVTESCRLLSESGLIVSRNYRSVSLNQGAVPQQNGEARDSPHAPRCFVGLA